MKKLIVRVIDTLVPTSVKSLKKTEELNRARAFIFVLFVMLVCSFVVLVFNFVHLIFFQSPFDSSLRLRLMAGLFGHSAALIFFRFTGRYSLCGNIFAFTFYFTVFLTALAWPGQALWGAMLYFLALPLLATFLASYTSGIAWLIIVAVTPLLLNIFGNTRIEPFFIGNWIAACSGLFVIIFFIYSYIQHLSQRLNHQFRLVEFAAAHDSLTGVPNRASFQACFEESIECCRQYGTKTVLAYIDLDAFKPINDIYGHHAGDVVLKVVADRLRSLVRDVDVVGRLGGDEFAIIFDRCDLTEIQPVLMRIMRGIKEPIVIDNHNVNVGCSIGLVVCPDDGLNALDLARKADERMYKAKRGNLGFAS